MVVKLEELKEEKPKERIEKVVKFDPNSIEKRVK